MFRLSRVALTFAAALGAGTAHAGLIPTTVTVTPEGGNFRWTYAVVLPSDMQLQAGDYFGIYNFHGLVPGSGSAPDGWSLSTPAVSPLSPNVTIFDDPAAPNLVWTYTGPTIPTGQIGLGNFWASSRSGSGERSLFVGRNARSGDGEYDTNISDVAVPSGDAAAPPGVPEPATLVLAGLGLPLVGLLRRRNGRSAEPTPADKPDSLGRVLL
jgi:hypothetical protein